MDLKKEGTKKSNSIVSEKDEEYEEDNEDVYVDSEGNKIPF